MIQIMTFNIRYGDAQDGENVWTNRRELVADVIRSYGPTVVGLQEALRYQMDFLTEGLPDYGVVGVGRDDGIRSGEHACIMYHRGRVSCLADGNFWFSDTPDLPGSKSWGNTLPRICTWARFSDLALNRCFYVFNVHWDHASQTAREKSGVLLLDQIKGRCHHDEPVVVTGDFNVESDNPAFMRLTTDEIGLRDVLRTAYRQEGAGGTFHEFSGTEDGGRIDAILVSPHWRIHGAHIDHLNEDGRYPSDHFPVTAEIE
ncbi:MAG: endonuclease/exonuclease/phosphatase family protein [Candidatus Latescibacteria bacterium]|nr:endonuclease/exonuclease/phosphatase family protein [Candidatus Latescibacterota bacterium]